MTLKNRLYPLPLLIYISETLFSSLVLNMHITYNLDIANSRKRFDTCCSLCQQNMIATSLLLQVCTILQFSYIIAEDVSSKA